MKAPIFRILGAVVLAAAMVCNTAVGQTSTEEVEKWRMEAEQGYVLAQFLLGYA